MKTAVLFCRNVYFMLIIFLGLVGAEGVVLKQQIQELIDENEILKETVERLNLELSKFQEKFGASSDVENSRGALSAVDRPKWLVC